MKITDIKLNGNNPRTIKDEKFKKLVQSIKDFPEMMTLRPLVIDETGTVLGGNMRLQAIKEIGYKDIPAAWVKRASDLTEDQKREFIIKDNVGFGEWDWDVIANEWDIGLLKDWGIDAPFYGSEVNAMTEDDLDMNEEFDPVGVSKGLQRVVFIFETKEEAEKYTNELGVTVVKRNNAWQVNMTSRSTL